MEKEEDRRTIQVLTMGPIGILPEDADSSFFLCKELFPGYLDGAKNGSKLRYAGLKGCTDYKKAVQIIKDGGYATSLTYVEKLISIIERRNLLCRCRSW